MTLSKSRKVVLNVEQLETRFAPATLVNATTLTYRDFDGDNVRVKFSKPILDAANANAIFSFDTGSVDGSNATPQQLRSINLAGIDSATGTSITTRATRSSVHGGDGFAAVGEIDALFLNLGKVTIDGDLGRFRTGTEGVGRGAAGLTVQSIGRFGTSTGAVDLSTIIAGAVPKITVKSDINEASIVVVGNIRSFTIGGSLIGGSLSLFGRVGNLTIGGSVIAGSGDNSGRIIVGQTRSINIAGSIHGGTGENSGAISASRLGSLIVGGSVIGGSGGNSGRIGNATFGARTIRIGGDLQGGAGDSSGSIVGKHIGRLTITGSLRGGTGAFQNNGVILVDDDIGAATIGDMIGTSTNPALISARGSAAPTATKDLAIGKVTVKGRAEFAQIAAGFGATGLARNADAQIGAVRIGGDAIALTIVAGVLTGANAFFGDGNDVKMAGANVKDVDTVSSRIKNVIIDGQVLGTFGGVDHFGIVAENVAAVKVGGASLPLLRGNSNDDVPLGITDDFGVHEV
jgi:hypothetical protein